MSNEPHISILNAHRNARSDWASAFSEWIDNSFDAKATRVVIRISARGKRLESVLIQDDGEGCSLQHLDYLVTLGGHLPHEGQISGRYGIGATESFLWAWGHLRVATIHQGQGHLLEIGWDDILHAGSWDYFHPTDVVPSPTFAAEHQLIDTSHSTTIRITRPEKKPPDINKLQQRLAFDFTPAIRSGRQIILSVNGHETILRAWELPAFVAGSTLDSRRDLGGGREYRVRAGVIRPGELREAQGWTIAINHRVITAGVTKPAGREYTVNGFSAWVDLIELQRGAWTLSKDKQAISEDHFDALCEDLRIVCEPLLKQAKSLNDRIVHDAIKRSIEESFKAAFDTSLQRQRDIKGKRQRPPTPLKPGTVTPTDRHKPHSTFSAAQDGPKVGIAPNRRRRNLGEIVIDWLNEGENQPYGRVDIQSDPPRVLLNLDHPFIVRYRNDLSRMHSIVVPLWAHAASTSDAGRQRWLPGMADDAVDKVYSQLCDRWLRAVAEEEPELRRLT